MPTPRCNSGVRGGAGRASRVRRREGVAACCGLIAVMELVSLPVQGEPAAAAAPVEGEDRTPTETKREVPDYDGREPEPMTPGEKAMLLPRAVLYPIHVALRLTLEKPIIAMLELIERYRIHYWLEWLLLWQDGKIGIFPTARYQFDLNLSFGFFFFIEDLILPGHALILEANFWVDDWQEIRFDNRLKISPDGTLFVLRMRYVDRPDQVFFGTGPATFESAESYYRLDLLEVSVGLKGFLPDLHRLRGDISWRRAKLGEGQIPSVETKHPLEENPELLGFGVYEFVAARLHLDIDSREKKRFSTSGSGVRFEGFGAFGVDPSDVELRVLTWGTEVSGFWDVTGHNNVLGVRGYVEFSEKAGSRSIPVTELITLGGLERMRGFLPGRFHGRSAFEATVQYRYPIWTYLDADLFVSFGNAFDGHLEGFELRLLHMTSGLAIRSSSSRQASFDLLVGFGTNRLDSEDVRIESVHFAVGINQGF